MNDQTQIGPRPHRQRTRRTRPITPARRRRRQRELLRTKRQNILYLLDERARNRARMRAVRARRKGVGDQIAECQAATHERSQ
jgi:hypothetical protein